MTDKKQILDLVSIASNSARLQAAQYEAARRLLSSGGDRASKDGCAITLSVLLQQAEIDVPDVFQALEFGQVLKSRGWATIRVGNQRAGDIGSTCGDKADYGFDHVYLVLETLNSDEMVVVSNQNPNPHLRHASGVGGKTPTRFFLRAPEQVSVQTSAPVESGVPYQNTENTVNTGNTEAVGQMATAEY